MRLSFIQRDVDFFQRVAPFVSSIVAVFLSVIPLHLPGLTIATPAFALMAIYHWTLYRPDLMPASGVFVIGLLLDLLDGTPYIGMSPLIFLIARGLVLAGRQRIANQPFPVVWAGFLAIAAVSIMIEWGAVSVLSGAPLGARPFIFQILVTAAAFPLAGYLLAQLHRAMLARV